MDRGGQRRPEQASMPPKPPLMIPTFTPSPVRPAACHALEPWRSTAGPASPLTVPGRIGRIASTPFTPARVVSRSGIRTPRRCARRGSRRGRRPPRASRRPPVSRARPARSRPRSRDRALDGLRDDEPRHELPSLRRREAYVSPDRLTTPSRRSSLIESAPGRPGTCRSCVAGSSTCTACDRVKVGWCDKQLGAVELFWVGKAASAVRWESFTSNLGPTVEDGETADSGGRAIFDSQ